MQVTHEEYLDTPSLVVSWDLELADVEAKVQAELQKRE